MTFDLARLDVPGPTATALTEPFWKAASEGTLNVQHCEACDRWTFYPRSRCPHCWSTKLTWQTASGDARLDSFTRIWKPGHPGWKPAAPYTVGLAKLAEGPVLLSLIVSADEAIEIGTRIRFVATAIGARILPCFSPIDSN